MQFAIQLLPLIVFRSRASTRPADERLTFSARAEKVSKETRPRHRTTRALRAWCPALLGAGRPARTRASLRSDMRAFPPPVPAMLGAVKGEEDQDRKAKAESKSFSFPCTQRGGRCPKGGKGAVALDLRVPVCRGEGRTEMLAESRARCARVRCTHTDVRSTNPGLTSRTAVGGAASGAASFWLLFLRWRRKSDPRAGCARKGEGTRHQSVKGIDHGVPAVWMPARPAGMTSQSSQRRKLSCGMNRASRILARRETPNQLA